MKAYVYSPNLTVLDLGLPKMAILTPGNAILDLHTPDPEKELPITDSAVSSAVENVKNVNALGYACYAIVQEKIG